MKQLLFFLLIGLCLMNHSCGSKKTTNNESQFASNEWKLEGVYNAYPDSKHLSGDLKDSLLKTTIAITNDTLIINGKYMVRFEEKVTDTDKYFDDDILKKFYIDKFKEKGIDISKSLSYLKFVDYFDSYTPNQEFSFDSYSLWSTIVYVDNYLCLPFERGGLLLYKKESQGRTSADLAILYEKLPLVPLPIEYSFDFVLDTPGFVSVPENLYPIFKLDHFSDLKFARLPVRGSIYPLLLFATNEAGDTSLFVYTFSDNYNVIDSLIIYCAYDINKDGEAGSKVTTYKITDSHEIMLEKTITSFSTENSKAVEKVNYYIDDNGKIQQKILR